MKRVNHLKLIILVLLAGIVMTDITAYAQCPVTVLTADGSTSGNARAPSVRYRKANAVYLLTPAEVAASGLVNGQNIGGISWNYTTAPGLAGTGTLIVYLQNTSDVTNTKSTVFTTAITGMTTVHNASTLIPNVTGFFDVTFSGGSPFTYTGGGLYVAFDWCYLSGTLSTTAIVGCNTTSSPTVTILSGQSTIAATCAALATASSFFRPGTRLIPASFANDAKVDLVYTYGSLPNVFTSGHAMQARITNVGSNPYTGNVTLNITGANSFSDVQTVTSVPACSSTVVTFAGYTPSSTGATTVSVSVPADDNNGNNVMSMSQPVTTNIYSYKYAAPITGGVGFNAGIFGVFVSKFNTAVAAAVNEVKVDFQSSSASRQFRIAIFDEIAGQPGNLLYVSPSVITISSAAQQAFIPISPNVNLPAGTFYAGVVQETSNTVNIGFSYQTENPTRIGTFFFANAFTGPWTDFGTPTVFPFRSAIEVQFFVPQPPNCALLNAPADGGVACINGTTLTWASGGGGPTGYKVYFGTNSTLVNNEDNSVLVQNSNATSYPTGALTNATYYWKVVAYNGDGDATGCSTRSFTTNLISCYCPSTATNGSFEYISNVQSGTFSNPTGSSLYANYIGLGAINSVPASPGGTFNVTVTMPVTQVYDEDRIYIFCDFNQDGDWNDSGELCGTADVTVAGGNVYNITCTVGAGVIAGNTVLRVKLGDEVSTTAMNNNPCQASYTYGEVEDYLISFACGVTASSNEPICENETLLLDATYLGGSTPTSWTWSGPNGFSASVEDPSRPSMTLADAGTYTVTVTDAASCSATTTVTVNVAPLPAVSASTNAPVCVGDALNVSSLPNGMLFYEWSGPNGFSAFTQNATVTNNAVIATHSGTYTVTVTSSFFCSATANVNVTINPRPVPYIISQTNVSCNGLSDGEVKITSSGAAPFLFDWSFNNDFGDTTTISGLSAQTLFVQVIDDNGCQSNPDLQVDITEPAVLTAGPTSNSPLCTTGTLNLSSNPAGGTAPYGYVWSGQNGFSSTDANPSLVNPSTANSGTYTVTVTDDNGCVTSATTSVTILAAPTAAVTGGGNLCLTQSGVVTLNFTGVGPWSGTVSDGVNSVNFGPTMNNPENVAVTPTLTGVRTYTVTALTDANCPAGTASGSAVFTVSSAPPASTIGSVNSPLSACSGTVTLVTTNVVSGQNIQYSWNTGSSSSTVLFSNNIGGPFVAGPFVSSTNQVYAQYGALGASTSGYNICVQGINGCGASNNKCNFTRGTVSTPVGITGSATQCSGATGQIYSVTGPAPAGVETYVWSFSVAGAVITPIDPPLNSQVSINFPAFSTGTLSVQAGLSCLGSSLSPARTLALSNATAAPAVPTGPIKVCPGSSYNYSVPTVAGATAYNWTVPANASITGGAGTNSITVAFDPSPINFVNGIVSVNTTSSCATTSSTTSKTVSSMVPSTPGNITGQTSGVCNAPYNYSVPAVAGVIYNWTLPAGASGSSSSNIISVTFSNTYTTGTISVTGSAAGCAVQSTPRTLAVSGAPATPAAITSPFPPCNGGPGQFETSPVFGASSYMWTVPANGTSLDAGQTTTLIDVTWGTGNGNVTVKADNACGSSGIRTLYYIPGCRLAEEEAVNISSLTVYPNPAHTQATIAFKAAEQGSYSITMTDVTGRTVRSIVTTAQAGVHQMDVNLESLAKGMYLIELRSDAGTEIQKLIVE